MGEYLLGLDNGGTVTKAALFDRDGREVQVASVKSEMLYPHPGWTERDAEETWTATAEAIRTAIARAGIAPQEIRGIGTTGYGNGVFLLDREGRPLRNGIVSTDTRAAGIVAEWERDGIVAATFPYTVQSKWAAQPNALLAWMKRHEPEIYRRIGAVLQIKDYVKYKLMGACSADFTDSAATSLIDVLNARYDPRLLELYGIPEVFAALPPMQQSFEIAGCVTKAAADATGLAPGTPVVAGIFDVEASALGAGVIHPGQACVISGTWSINEVVTTQPLIDAGLFMTVMYTVPGLWLTIEGSPTSATNLEWFVSNFCGEEQAEARRRGISVYDVCNEMVAKLPVEGCEIIFHPFLYGSDVQASARAGFYGLAGWHTKAHVLQALYEGVVFSHLHHIEKLRAAGAKIERVRFAGGSARSVFWTQMFADALNVALEVPESTELGAFGAALSAGIGVGVYRDHADATARAVHTARVHEPNPAQTPRYLARYAEYCRLLEAMAVPWQSLARLSSGG